MYVTDKLKRLDKSQKPSRFTVIETFLVAAIAGVIMAALLGCGRITEMTAASMITNGYIAQLNEELQKCPGIKPINAPPVETLIVNYRPGGGGAAYQKPNTILIWEKINTFFAHFGHEYVRHTLYHQDNHLWSHSSSDWSPPTLNCCWNAAETISRGYDQ